jgi:hypothetical protein
VAHKKTVIAIVAKLTLFSCCHAPENLTSATPKIWKGLKLN